MCKNRTILGEKAEMCAPMLMSCTCIRILRQTQPTYTDIHSHSATHHTWYTDAGVLKSRGRSKLPSCPQRLTSSLQENSDYVSLHGPVGVSSVTILPSTHQGLSLRLVPSTHSSFHHFRTLTGLSSDQGHPEDLLLRPTRESHLERFTQST